MTAPARRPAKARDLSPDPENPRTVEDKALKALRATMARFGDLSGIVFNRRTGLLIGGHQRVTQLPPAASITITERLKKPNAQGTTAVGYVMVEGERWTYREVDVDATVALEMNLRANHAAGAWDDARLPAILGRLQNAGADLDALGFDKTRLVSFLAAVPGSPPAPGELDPGDGRYVEQYGVIVMCKDAKEQESIYERLVAEGLTCRVVVT